MPVILTPQTRLTTPLLTTRFFLPPLPVTNVPRPRLVERMQQGLRAPLTLVSAPPGFGKSTIAGQWIRSQADLKASWLSLEPSQQDWGLFFRYLVAAWQRIFPQAGEMALELWKESPATRRETLLDLLINDLTEPQTAPGQALLVLDDYHRVESSEIHETIAYLVEQLPPGCHLALMTRADPPLPLARWRSRGQVLEIRADDLRFTASEALEYLNQGMHLGLAETQAGRLLVRTEGWIAGLQMAALSLQGHRGGAAPGAAADSSADAGSEGSIRSAEVFVRDFDGSNRFVLDYLVEEVVNSQPEEVQRFLLATSLLEQFCGALCDALLGTSAPYSQGMLERLEKANLFLIPLDDRRCWFRYHHLFADLLRLRLRQTLPGQIPAFYRKAAEWYAQNGQEHEAVRCALETKDLDYSAGLLERVILQGGLDFLYSGIGPAVDPFPADMVESRPLLSLAKAVAIYDRSQLEGIEPLLRFAEDSLLNAMRIQTPPSLDQKNSLGWIYAVKSSVAVLSGDLDTTIASSQQVRRWIPEDRLANIEALAQLGNAFYYRGDFNQTEATWQQALDASFAGQKTTAILDLLDGLARLCFQKGELNRAETLFQRGLDLLEAHPGQYLAWAGAMQREYSDVLRERSRLDEAQDRLTRALPLLEKWHSISAYGFGLVYMARLLFSRGDIRGAHESLNRADEICRTYATFPDLEGLAQVTRARLFLQDGEVERAWQTLDACLQSECCQHEPQREWVLFAQARILARTGRPAEALALLAGRMESAKANGRGRNWLSMGLITAEALSGLGNMQDSLLQLEEALAFGQDQNFRRLFVEEGEPVRALLEDFRVRFPQSALVRYVTELLSIFPAAPREGINTSGPVDGLYETLTPREEEILHLVCQGLSNQEIARQLVLAVGTVKFHIHQIFGKLGVRDRPQAIAKAAVLFGPNRRRIRSK